MNQITKPSIPRAEYPTPQFARENWMNLNGEGEYSTDRAVSGDARQLYMPESDAFTETITVPFCRESELSGIGDKDFCECVWYRKKLTLPEDWQSGDKRVILHVGACDYVATVYVNGKKIGKHIGGFVSFSFDITPALTEGENTIVISAYDDTRSGNQPGGKQSLRYGSYGCYYTRTTGIWQTVWLECVPGAYLKSARYLTDVAASTLTVEAKAVSPDGTPFKAEAYWEGKKVGEASAVTTFGCATVQVKLSELHLWELGKGGLYDLVLTLGDDVVKSYFGMRSLGLDDSNMLLFTATNVRVYDLQEVINVCEHGVRLQGGLPPCLFPEIPCERTIRTQVSDKRLEGVPTKDSPHVFQLIVRSSHEVIA